jgi:hypothetical protein
MTTRFEVAARNRRASAWAEAHASTRHLPRFNSWWMGGAWIPDPFDPSRASVVIHGGGSPVVVCRNDRGEVYRIRRF